MSSSDIAPQCPTQLDHVIILVLYSYLDSPPEWLKENFTISPGGQHADGKTANRLVVFKDGSYLELIAFVNDDPEKRKGRYWDKPFGIVDFALTTRSTFDYAALKARLEKTGSGISYATPQAGGRSRPDGVELQWKVTFPTGAKRGDVPFWCHDVTPRERRVPVTDASATHPCGALGMAGMFIEVIEDKVKQVDAALPAVTDEAQKNGACAVGHPVDVEGLEVGWVRVAPLKSGGGIDQRLALSLQTPGGASRDIKADIEDGGLVIRLEG